MINPLKLHINRIKDLSTDGCTGAPDLWFRSCCVAHDLAYRNPEVGHTRVKADRNLWRCIRNKTHGGVILASVYWLGVRLFGGRAWRANHE